MNFPKSLLALVFLASIYTIPCGKSGDPVSPEEEASASLLTELDPIAPAEGKSTFEGIVPIVQGKSEALQVGRMNGIVPRSLLRFRMPADSLARALGRCGRSRFAHVIAQDSAQDRRRGRRSRRP